MVNGSHIQLGWKDQPIEGHLQTTALDLALFSYLLMSQKNLNSFCWCEELFPSGSQSCKCVRRYPADDSPMTPRDTLRPSNLNRSAILTFLHDHHVWLMNWSRPLRQWWICMPINHIMHGRAYIKGDHSQSSLRPPSRTLSLYMYKLESYVGSAFWYDEN